MPRERRSAGIYDAAADLLALPGPYAEKFAVLLSNVRLYKWVPDDTSTPDGELVIGHTGGGQGNWLLVPEGGGVIPGADLTDADATITITQGSWRVLPDATLSANHILTLGNTGASRTHELTITRFDVTANTYTIKNAAGTTLSVFPASQQCFGRYVFDGTDWQRMMDGQLL